jgi:hypothetical protein
MNAERWARVQRLGASSFAGHRQRAVHVRSVSALRRPATAATSRHTPLYVAVPASPSTAALARRPSRQGTREGGTEAQS